MKSIVSIGKLMLVNPDAITTSTKVPIPSLTGRTLPIIWCSNLLIGDGKYSAIKCEFQVTDCGASISSQENLIMHQGQHPSLTTDDGPIEMPDHMLTKRSQYEEVRTCHTHPH